MNKLGAENFLQTLLQRIDSGVSGEVTIIVWCDNNCVDFIFIQVAINHERHNGKWNCSLSYILFHWLYNLCDIYNVGIIILFVIA